MHRHKSQRFWAAATYAAPHCMHLIPPESSAGMSWENRPVVFGALVDWDPSSPSVDSSSASLLFALCAELLEALIFASGSAARRLK
jgi:hypothetical protein